MTPNGLLSDSLVISGIRGSLLYRLAAGRAEFLFLCLVVFLMPLIPVPLSALLILATGLIFLLKGRLSLRRIAGLPLFKQVLVFWCVMLLYSIFSVVPVQSLQVTALYGIFILFYFMCRIEIGDGRRLHLLAASFLASVAVQSLIGLYQNFISVPLVDPSWVDVKEFPEIMVRVFGTLDNPNILAQYLVPGIVLGTGLFLQERRPGLRLLSLAAAGLAAYCLYFTWSRGGILALGAALALFLALYNRRLFLVAVFLGVLAVAFKPALLTNRLASITNIQDTSIAYRFIIWSIAFNIIRDFWFSGVGVGTAAFRYVYDRFYTIYGVTAMHTHDFFIELLVEIGVFGFLIFLWLLASYFISGLRRVFRMENGPAKTVTIASLAGMAGYLVQGITEQPWYNFKMVFLFWFLLTLGQGERQGDGSPVCAAKTRGRFSCLRWDIAGQGRTAGQGDSRTGGRFSNGQGDGSSVSGYRTEDKEDKERTKEDKGTVLLSEPRKAGRGWRTSGRGEADRRTSGLGTDRGTVLLSATGKDRQKNRPLVWSPCLREGEEVD